VRVAALLRKTTNGGQLTLGANAAADWGNAGHDHHRERRDHRQGGVRQTIGITPNVA
jgi:hypothetical protein